MLRWVTNTALVVLLGAGVSSACSGGKAEEEASGTSGGSTDTGGTGSSTGGSSSGGPDAGPKQLISVTPIPGGGVNSGPLQPGCGPETAQECLAPGGGCNNDALLSGGVEVKDAGAVCFYGEGQETPSATVEHITEVVNGQEYVHLRVVFDPNFVDTAYGECSAETGWNPKRPHTLKDLYGSDHVELMLHDCADELSMHLRVDFLSDKQDTPCGYATQGVTGGDGKVIVGDADHVLAVGTSLDRNMNGCGYCEETDSPCPGGEGYDVPSVEAPEWDFRMVYELWLDADAFGAAGFCRSDIEYVHASPAKADDDTVLVEPDDCPPPPGGGGNGSCPPNYELYLSSEGEYLCAGPPDGGVCPSGYEIDLTSEGELCIPLGEQ